LKTNKSNFNKKGNIITCSHCRRNYKNFYTFNRHTEKCQLKTKIVQNTQIINNIDNSTNVTNVTNVTNIDNSTNINLNIVAFGEEDLTKISDKVCKYILNKGFQSILTLIEYIHFNRKHPQNHNVYIPNMRAQYAMIYDGLEWMLNKKREILGQLYDDKFDYLENKFELLKEQLDDMTKKKFTRYLSEKDDENVISKIKTDIELLLYNKRKLIKD